MRRKCTFPDSFDLAQMLLKHLKKLPGDHILVTQICKKCTGYNQSNVLLHRSLTPSQRCPGLLLLEAKWRRIWEACKTLWLPWKNICWASKIHQNSKNLKYFEIIWKLHCNYYLLSVTNNFSPGLKIQLHFTETFFWHSIQNFKSFFFLLVVWKDMLFE